MSLPNYDSCTWTDKVRGCATQPAVSNRSAKRDQECRDSDAKGCFPSVFPITLFDLIARNSTESSNLRRIACFLTMPPPQSVIKMPAWNKALAARCSIHFWTIISNIHSFRGWFRIPKKTPPDENPKLFIRWRLFRGLCHRANILTSSLIGDKFPSPACWHRTHH